MFYFFGTLDAYVTHGLTLSEISISLTKIMMAKKLNPLPINH